MSMAPYIHTYVYVEGLGSRRYIHTYIHTYINTYVYGAQHTHTHVQLNSGAIDVADDGELFGIEMEETAEERRKMLINAEKLDRFRV
jgi:hypothetical protein